jgi:uncharacterized protein (DUF433 family)
MSAKSGSADLKALPVTVDPEILGGTPVFRGTRVPVKSLFDYLRWNYSLEDFLEYFPSVSREAAEAVLSGAERTVLCAGRAAEVPPLEICRTVVGRRLTARLVGARRRRGGEKI